MTVSSKPRKVYTAAEVAKHNSLEKGIWFSVGDKVYAVDRSWLAKHPGGDLPIHAVAGKDCTDTLGVFHAPEVLARHLPRFQIGVLAQDAQREKCTQTAAATALRKDYDAIVSQLEAEGAFASCYWWYTRKWLVQFALAAAVLFGLFTAESFLGYMSVAVLLGLFWHQMAFLGHDYGHNSVSGTQAGDRLGSFIVTVCFGTGAEWWKRSHNVHHVVTNSIEEDPDIQYLPIFSIAPGMLADYWSTFHRKWFRFDAASRFLVSKQHFLYYPVMFLVARYNLTLQSLFLCVPALLPGTSPLRRKERLVDLLALCLYLVWFSVLLASLPSWKIAVPFVIVSHAVAGLVHVQITLSHFGMETRHTIEGEGTDRLKAETGSRDEEFVPMQFATTMDVDCPVWLDWLHGGLQFQLVHHLFPRLPRHRLRYVRDKYVLPLAARHGLHYQLYPFFEANARVFRALRLTAQEAAVKCA